MKTFSISWIYIIWHKSYKNIFKNIFFIQVSINNYLNYTVQHTEIIRVEPLRGCVGPGAKPPRGPLWGHNCKMGEAVFYNMLHFIAYYTSLMQLGFIFLLNNLVSINFKGFRCFGGLVKSCPPSRRPWIRVEIIYWNSALI